MEERKQIWQNCTSIFNEKHLLVADHIQEPGLGRNEDLLTPFVAKSWDDLNYGSYDSHVACSKEDFCVPERSQYGTRTCGDCYSGTVRVATYNIWNLNSLDTEAYHSRLERIGKVGT